MKKDWLLLTALLVVMACENVEMLGHTYPSYYRAVRFENTTTVRLFTQSGEVTDAGLTERFTQRFGQDFLFPSNLTRQINPPDSIRLLSESDAQLKVGSIYKNFILIINGNGKNLSFLPQDTARSTARNEFEFNLHTAIGIRKPIYQKKNTVPGTAGSISTFDVVEEKFAMASSGQLDFPVVNYVLTRGGGLNRNVRKVSFNNQFDPTAHRMLQAGDTLAVQEFKMTYEKN
jgi:hypothetical protein